MSLSIDELFKAGTPDEVLESFLDILETLKLPARSWRVAGSLRTILRVVTSTYAGYTQVMSAFIKAGFLETAEDDWLTLLARNVYNVERVPASNASGEITFTNGGGGVFSFGIGEVRVLWHKTSSITKAYTNTEAFVLNPSDVLDVAFAAVEAGSNSSAPAGEINEIETTMLGVTCTNGLPFIGSDAEKDEALRARCLAKLAALSPLGPRGAYQYAITSALLLDGSPVSVNRSQISPSSSTGVVDIWIATPSGTPSGPEMTAVAANIEAIARPDTVQVNLNAAVAVPYTATLTVWAKAVKNVSVDQLEELIQANLANLIAAYPIGGLTKPPSTAGFLFATEIDGAVTSAHSSIYSVDGAIDLPIALGQVATLAATLIVRVV